MAKVPQICDQHRQAIGVYTNQLNNKQINQSEYIKILASQPGLHRGNAERQKVALSLLNFVSIISSIRHTDINPAISSKRANELSIINRLANADSLYLHPYAKQNINKGREKGSRDDTKQTNHSANNISKFKLSHNGSTQSPELSVNEPINIASSTLTTIFDSVSHTMQGIDKFISQHDFLQFPAAQAMAVKKNQQINNTYVFNPIPTTDAKSLEESQKINNERLLRRLPRYVVLPEKNTPSPWVPDDVKIQKVFDSSCINDGENLSFAQVLRQIGQTLQHPITMLSLESKKVDYWNKGLGCPSQEEIDEIIDITQYVDTAVSLVLTQLPGSSALATAQYIVGPLLEYTANALENKPISRSDIVSFLEQISQQGKMSLLGATQQEVELIKKDPPEKPNKPHTEISLPVFDMKNNVNHIKLDIDGNTHLVPINLHNGEIKANVPKDIGGVKAGEYKVYFNHVSNKWEIKGGKKFNRFSKKEQSFVHRFSLQTGRSRNHSDKTKIYGFVYHGEPMTVIEMFGRTVPYLHDVKSGKSYIYDANNIKGRLHEVEVVEGEWHLKKRNNNVQEKNDEVNNNNNKPEVTQEEIIEYDEMDNCHRVKRGAVLGKLCKNNSGNDYPVLAEGSISIVYDMGDGTVLKQYKGEANWEYKSRLQSANNNVKGFNRYYGESSANTIFSPKDDGSITVFARLKKIDGIPLNSIEMITDKAVLISMKEAIKAGNLSETLSNKLKEKGIMHYDINQGNVIYNKKGEFLIIDFDSAMFSPDGKAVSDSDTEEMKNKFKYVFSETLNDINIRLRELNT